MKKKILKIIIFILVIQSKMQVYAQNYNMNYGDKIHLEGETSYSIDLPKSEANITIKISNVISNVSYLTRKSDDLYSFTSEYISGSTYNNIDVTTVFNSSLSSYSIGSGQMVLDIPTVTSGFGSNFIMISGKTGINIEGTYYTLKDFSFDIEIVNSRGNDIILEKDKIVTYLDSDIITLNATNYSSQITWSCTNKKVAEISPKDTMDSTEISSYVYIYPKKKGTCYILATSNGKTVRCKLIVKLREKFKPGALLDSYSTRNNEFDIVITNYSNNSMTILKNDIVAANSDYRSFDRYLKLKKNVTIKPGKSKVVTFKVEGKVTWWDVDTFTINYWVKYKGKKYRVATDTDASYIYKGKRWKKLYQE